MTDDPAPTLDPTLDTARYRLTKDTIRAMEWMQRNQKRPVEMASTDWILKRLYDWQQEH